MSVITIIATNETIIVASDSKVTGGRIHEAFPKIREYQPDIAFFCMGNASFAYHAFKFIDKMKELHGHISFHDAVAVVNENKAAIEANPPFENFRSLFGVCGFNNGEPTAYVTMINPKDRNEFQQVISSENGTPAFLVLHPADMSFTHCQKILSTNIRATENLGPSQMVSVCQKTIFEMCEYSQLINHRIQYWLYRAYPETHMTRLIQEIPE